MGFRFSKRIKIAPGIQLNLSKSGVGVSVGAKGLKISTGPKGTRLTASLPGTGISYTKQIGKKKSK